MMKKLKKAFTITELVIVIAVIAILAAVLIPTFSNVIQSANESASMQNNHNAFSSYMDEKTGLVSSEGNSFEGDTYYVFMNSTINSLGTGSSLTKVDVTLAANTTYTFTVSASAEGVTAANANGVHQIAVGDITKLNSNVQGKIGFYASPVIQLNGVYYVSIFLYQPYYTEAEGDSTNYYGTAYIYSGTYFTFTENPGEVTVTATAPSTGD